MPMGRPEKPIDEKMFWKLMSIPFANKDSVAECLDVHPDTLLNWIKDRFDTTFSAIKQQKMEGLKLKLAGKQFEAAMNGNISMQIWLGKQYLGQADKVEQKQQIESKQLIEYVADWNLPEIPRDVAPISIATEAEAPTEADPNKQVGPN